MPVFKLKKHRSHLNGKEWYRFQSQWQDSTDKRYTELLKTLREQWKQTSGSERAGTERWELQDKY